jgi:hypothetical protein
MMFLPLNGTKQGCMIFTESDNISNLIQQAPIWTQNSNKNTRLWVQKWRNRRWMYHSRIKDFPGYLKERTILLLPIFQYLVSQHVKTNICIIKCGKSLHFRNWSSIQNFMAQIWLKNMCIGKSRVIWIEKSLIPCERRKIQLFSNQSGSNISMQKLPYLQCKMAEFWLCSSCH